MARPGNKQRAMALAIVSAAAACAPPPDAPLRPDAEIAALTPPALLPAARFAPPPQEPERAALPGPDALAARAEALRARAAALSGPVLAPGARARLARAARGAR